MNASRRILVVAKDAEMASALGMWLQSTPHHVIVERSFAAGKAALRMAPDLLITELKLGDFNGLHLALCARTQGAGAIVIGPNDHVLERDARDFDAAYFASPVSRHTLLRTAGELLGDMDARGTRLASSRDSSTRQSLDELWNQPVTLAVRKSLARRSVQ
jgi:DNA-binding response OmpR family regulator